VRTWVFSGHRIKKGFVGSVINQKAYYIKKAKEIQPEVTKILNTIQKEHI